MQTSALAWTDEAGRFDISRVPDLEGQRVAVPADDAALEALSRRPRIKVRVVDSPERGLALLQAGSVDAFVGERLSALRFLSERRLQNRLKMVGPDVARARFGWVVRAERAQLGEKLEQGLKSWSVPAKGNVFSGNGSGKKFCPRSL